MTRDLDTLIDDTIDSRDLIERLEELEGIAEEGTEEELDDDERAELDELREICEEGESSFDDWPYGVGLIADSYFEQYAQQFAEDIGAIPDDAGWPCTCIDWEQAARELQMDYSSIEIRGTTYWGR